MIKRELPGVIENPNEPVEDENKNVAPIWSMRIAGGLLDLLLIFLITFGLNNLFMNTPMADSYHAYRNEIIDVQDYYKLQPLVPGSEETYGHMVIITPENAQEYSGYRKHNLDGSDVEYVVVNNESIDIKVYEAYNKAVSEDATYKKAHFNYRFIAFGITSLAAGITELILIFAIPMLNKRSATIGQLLGGTQVIHNKLPGRAKWYQLLGRFFVVFIIETELFYLLLNAWTLIVAPVVTYLVCLTNEKRKTFHDFLTGTRIITKESFEPLVSRDDK